MKHSRQPIAWCFGGGVGFGVCWLRRRRQGGPRRPPRALRQGKGHQFASVSREASPPPDTAGNSSKWLSPLLPPLDLAQRIDDTAPNQLTPVADAARMCLAFGVGGKQGCR